MKHALQSDAQLSNSVNNFLGEYTVKQNDEALAIVLGRGGLRSRGCILGVVMHYYSLCCFGCGQLSSKPAPLEMDCSSF